MIKTISQAIKALPELDKRWKHSLKDKNCIECSTIFFYSTIGIKYNSIEEYHAAAKMLGYEIAWGKYYELGYHPVAYKLVDGINNCGISIFKTPKKAIEAAFIYVINDLEKSK